MATDTISFGGHYGGPRTGTVLHHHDRLKRLLWKHCQGPYSPEVEEFALVLRVDGTISAWHEEGCERLRRSFKDRYITLDLMVPQPRYQGRSPQEIRQYLAGLVEEAFTMIVRRLKKDKTPLDEERLMGDWCRAKEEYLAFRDLPLTREEEVARDENLERERTMELILEWSDDPANEGRPREDLDRFLQERRGEGRKN